MKYITFDHDECRTYRHDYNTDIYTETELLDIIREWNEEDDGHTYYLSDEI